MEMRRRVTSRTLQYLFFVLRVQEPNAENDNPECSTPPSTHPPQVQRIYSKTGVFTLGSTLPGKMSAGLERTCMHFFIKWSKADQMASVPKAGICVQLWQWRSTENATAVPLTPHPSSSSKIGGHSHLRASAPPFYPWYGGAMWLQSSQIQHSYWCSHVQ